MGAVEVEPLLIKILKSYWVDIRVIYLILDSWLEIIKISLTDLNCEGIYYKYIVCPMESKGRVASGP